MSDVEKVIIYQSIIVQLSWFKGVLTDYLRINKNKNVYDGIDLSIIAIKNAKMKRRGFNLQQADLTKFTPTKKYNFIVFNEVLYYVDHEEEIKRYSKFLDSNGVITISLWSRDSQKHDKEDIFDFASSHLKLLHSMSFSGLTTSTVNNETRIAHFYIKSYQKIM